MNPAQLLAHFDRISDAPDAIPRLRRFILDLAVRGKLVEQDPRDEPASELLKCIQTEKDRLVKAGEIRKANPFPKVEADEVPFSPPAGWEWVRIRQVTGDRGQVEPNYIFTYIDVTAINKELGRIADAKVLSASDAPSRARKLVKQGDVLYSCVRPYLLNIAVVESEIVPPPIASTAFAVLNGFGLVLPRYLWIALRSPFMVECVEGKMRGQAYPAINDSDFAQLPFPLPPLFEQTRIVAKVDELMALCDRLEAAQAERESRRDRLVGSSLNSLNNGADPDAFRNHARLYFNHLPRLTTRTEHIQQLRQTILNLAVRGKLVPQDPNDEPVSELLKRTGAEKSQDEPFLIPVSWAWVSVDQVGDSRLGKMLDKAKNKGTPRRYLRNVNVRWFDFDLSDVFQMPFEDDELEEFTLHRDDVLICEGGEPGRAAVWDEREEQIYFQKAIHRVRFSRGVSPHFFVNALRESADSGRLATYFTGVGIKHFTGKGLASFVFPLPPLGEQHRIVAKVDELMALCDRLKAQLTTTQTESRHLLEAVLHEALNPALEKLA